MSTPEATPTEVKPRQRDVSVVQAKKILHQARLNEHRESVRKALTKSDAEFAKMCSRFFASFTNKGKKKASK